MKMLDIVEIVLASRENSNVTYDIKLNEKKIGDITIMEKGIENIWIAEEYRRKGYGTMLLNHVEWIIKIACYPQIEVEAVGIDAEPFFKKNGYVLSEDAYGEYRGHKKLK